MEQASGLAGVSIAVSWNDDVLFDSPPSLDQVNREVDEAIAGLESSLDLPDQVRVGHVATLDILPSGGNGTPCFACEPYAPDSSWIYRRLRRVCKNALEQLASYSDIPGVIVLDADDDGLARNGLNELAEWTLKQRELGAILVVAKEHTAKLFTHVAVLPGPRFGETPDILGGLERCDQGHIHFQPLSSLPSPCPTAFSFTK